MPPPSQILCDIFTIQQWLTENLELDYVLTLNPPHHHRYLASRYGDKMHPWSKVMYLERPAIFVPLASCNHNLSHKSSLLEKLNCI